MILAYIFISLASINCISTLTAVEVTFLTTEVMEYFKDISEDIRDEILEANHQKREISRDEQSFASLFAPMDMSKPAHYWTRKRGKERETTTEPNSNDDYYYRRSTKRPPNSFDYDFGYNMFDGRKKRENTPVEASTKILPDKQIEMSTEDIVKKNIEKRRNKCCADEQEMPGITQSLSTAKTQCLIETREGRKNNSIADESAENESKRLNQWKTVVTCTMDCVGKVTGMIDSEGFIYLEKAKEIVTENFARQKWEQIISDGVVEKCVAATSKDASKNITAYGFECNSKAAEFSYCIWRELLLTCPVNKQDKSERCEKLRSVLTKHEINEFKN